MSSSFSPNVPQPNGTPSPSSAPVYGTFSDDPAATSNLENVVLLQPISNFSPRRRRWKACICYCIFVLIACFAVWLVFVYFLGQQPFSCLGHFPVISPPGRKVPRDWNAFRNQSWAVGFDLTAGYGASSVAFNNGTIVDVVKWQQGTQYNDVLERASRKVAQHPTPPYYNCTAIREDVGRQWNRW
jgi:hypothetical protein